MRMDDDDGPVRQGRQFRTALADTGPAHGPAADAERYIGTEAGPDMTEVCLRQSQAPQAVEAARTAAQSVLPPARPAAMGIFFRYGWRLADCPFYMDKVLARPCTLNSFHRRPVQEPASELPFIGVLQGHGITKADRLKDGINIVITIGTTAGYRQGQINFSRILFLLFKSFFHSVYKMCIVLLIKIFPML